MVGEFKPGMYKKLIRAEAVLWVPWCANKKADVDFNPLGIFYLSKNKLYSE